MHLLRKVIAAARFDTIDQLIEIVRSVGKRLVQSQPRGEREGKYLGDSH